MNEDIKEKIKLILDPPRPQPIFSEDDVITLDLVDYIRGLPSHVNMSKLFVKPNHLGARRQKVEEQCCDCGKVFITVKNANKCIDYLTKGFVHRCPDCDVVYKKSIETVRLANQEEHKKQKQQSTNKYIDIYLSPNNSWKANTKNWVKITELRKDVDFDEVATYIKSMDYRDFLASPYWQAVAEKVKIKNDWRCEICGKQSNNLNVHHPNYDFHGYELQNIAKLKCLCKDCHEKFHKK